MIYRDILEQPQNELRDYIAEGNRTREKPLTMYRLEKTFFAEFIAPPPLNDEFESENYHWDEERDNFVRLVNLIVERVLAERWAPERKEAAHVRATRIFSAGALRAWVPFLRDALAPAFKIFEQRTVNDSSTASSATMTSRTLAGSSNDSSPTRSGKTRVRS